MHFFLATFLILLAALVVSMFAQFIAISLTKTPINDVTLFYGRPIAKVRISDTNWRLGWIPMGGSIAYDLDRFAKMPLWTRLAVRLAGPLTPVLIGAMILGINRATHSLLVGIPQYFTGALYPRGNAFELISKLEYVFSVSLTTAIAIVILKFAAMNLLPFVSACFREIVGQRIKLSVVEGIATLAAFVALIATGSWVFAFCTYLFKK